jgi:hypothetical protein
MDEGEYDGKAGVHVRAAGRDPAQVVDTRRAAVVTMKFRYGNSRQGTILAKRPEHWPV